uniref:Uncharacterized protein n=1 Tax=Melicertus latisulcatus majanivirus TaxID=2984277 RepID=A0A9C7EYG9_9VIRU|nr:MAG: hypothetical protein [Melicertus latisulcatus majanivirus]
MPLSTKEGEHQRGGERSRADTTYMCNESNSRVKGLPYVLITIIFLLLIVITIVFLKVGFFDDARISFAAYYVGLCSNIVAILLLGVLIYKMK